MRLLVTGGRSLIGKAIVERREKLGDEVWETSSRMNPGSSEKKGARTIAFDLENPTASVQAIEELFAIGLDGVVLNAASPTPPLRKFHRIPLPEISAFLRKNIDGNLWLLQQVIPHFVKRGYGRIVFISSLMTEYATPGYSPYLIAKEAMEGAIRQISVEYAGKNVIANTVRLGIFNTERNTEHLKDEAHRKAIVDRIGLGKLGDPAQAAEALDVLLSEKTYIVGATIDVGGGLRIPS
jgi:NAD(P)-dependent dehydrogenase (short-subunit alcohol dehydrogenase family)